MIDTIIASFLGLISSPYLMGLILLAIPIGMFFGSIPGLGGKLGVALLIPFVFNMDMVSGAGHIIGANQTYNAMPDGLTIETFNTGLIYAQILNRKGMLFDLTDMKLPLRVLVRFKAVAKKKGQGYEGDAESTETSVPHEAKSPSSKPAVSNWSLSKQPSTSSG